MTYSSSPSVATSSRPRTGRALAALREWLQALHARRRDLHVQRREARTLRAVSEMDAHLLRDIGAPEELISRAIEDRNSRLPREFLFQLATRRGGGRHHRDARAGSCRGRRQVGDDLRALVRRGLAWSLYRSIRRRRTGLSVSVGRRHRFPQGRSGRERIAARTAPTGEGGDHPAARVGASVGTTGGRSQSNDSESIRLIPFACARRMHS